MPTTDGRHERDGEIPRWAATAGKHTLRAPRWVSRLFRPDHRATDDSEPQVPPPDVSGPIRHRVRREYRAATLAKARRISEQWVHAGFNTGTVPYGYRAQRVRITPGQRRARWRTLLVIEPAEAATVKMIFTWRGEDRLSVTAIRQRLAPDTGQPAAWTHATITSILRNPKYLGRQVRGRCHHGRRTPHQLWVWSPVQAHPPIVSSDEFIAANHRTILATALLAADSTASELPARRAA
ncbi:recombinase family protein [Amycolatopsis panacis]|uniref:Recombinase n=1 Tax=Amycolatopsis panacis TaxID=2340917 RepID=A0A419I700_9PSEU|nr:recombinase family protein [Amycolatopsis panacis]RJQ87222.1 recombinase [Amycolatopsis panacis]